MHSDVFEVIEPPPAQPRERNRSSTPKLRPTCELLAYATVSLRRDSACADDRELRDAGWLLGGLTAPVVINVMHQFMHTPRGKLDRGVQRLGDLCGALFLEFMCHAAGRDPRDAAELGHALTNDPEQYDARFMLTFTVTPERALKLFLQFFVSTQRAAHHRLAFSLYGIADGE